MSQFRCFPSFLHPLASATGWKVKPANSKISAPWVSFPFGLTAQKIGLPSPPKESQAGLLRPARPWVSTPAGQKDSPCCPSEGVPAAGCEPGVLMAILVALWSRKVLSLFLGT